MERAKAKNLGIFAGLLIAIVGWTLVLMFFRPSEIVAWLGVTNSYLVAFLISIFGAIASITPVSTYPGIYTMAAGGIHPLLLAPIAAAGLTIGDYIFVFFGLSARGALSERITDKIENVMRWLNDKPTRFIQVFIFVWVGFLPIANNLLTAPLAMTGFHPRKMFVPLVLGNLMLPLLATSLAYHQAGFV